MKKLKYFCIGLVDEIKQCFMYSVNCYIEQGKKVYEAAKLQDPDAEYMQKLDQEHDKITLHNDENNKYNV